MQGAKCEQIRPVDDAITEREERRKCIARQCGEKKVQGDRPAGPTCNTRPRLDNRPPEQESGHEERCMLNFMPPLGAQPERKHRRNMPSNDRSRRRKPTKSGMSENLYDPMHRAAAEKRSNGALNKAFGQSVQQR